MEGLHEDDPERLGPYEIVRVLGAGGMGKVYLGRDADGVEAAVKVVHADLARDPEFRRRFTREVEAGRKVRGPHMAAVLLADVGAAQPWLATEYVPAPSLWTAVADHGPLAADEVRELGAVLAEALAAVHDAGLVHRDVKPSNILLAADGPKLIDFGIAHDVALSTMTRTGVVLGTPQCMAPEQLQGLRGKVGPAADVFALGGALAYAATGRFPFGDGNPTALSYRIVHEAPDLDGLARPLRDLLARCLDKDPVRRPLAAELAEELRAEPRTHQAAAVAVAADVADVADVAGGPAEAPISWVEPVEAAKLAEPAEATPPSRSMPPAGTEPSAQPPGTAGAVPPSESAAPAPAAAAAIVTTPRASRRRAAAAVSAALVATVVVASGTALLVDGMKGGTNAGSGRPASAGGAPVAAAVNGVTTTTTTAISPTPSTPPSSPSVPAGSPAGATVSTIAVTDHTDPRQPTTSTTWPPKPTTGPQVPKTTSRPPVPTTPPATTTAASSPTGPPPKMVTGLHSPIVQYGVEQVITAGWNPQPDATSFDIHYSNNGNAQHPSVDTIDNTTGTSYTMHVYPGESFCIYLRARNQYGVSDWGTDGGHCFNI